MSRTGRTGARPVRTSQRTTVSTDARLLVGLGSGCAPATIATFDSLAGRDGRTPIFTDAERWLASAPSWHRTTLGAISRQAPWLGDSATSVTLAGRMSNRLTFVASAGPLFVTWIRYVRFA